MWARRCGAPKRWPSRVKVIFFSFFSGTIGLSIYMYMAGSNISYLDLEAPASEEVLCLAEWPLRAETSPLYVLQEWLRGRGRSPRTARALKNGGRCEAPGVEGTSCRSVTAPVHDMRRPLALAMAGPPAARYDVLGTWAHLFLALTFCIWIGMTTHDLALIGQAQRDFILDVSGVNQHCPTIRSVWRCLAGYRSLARMVTQEQPGLRALGIALAVLLAPVLLAWNVVVFNFVVVPLLLLAFARHPIRMSRAWVFIVCIACGIYGLALTLLQVGYMVSEGHRPRYAVTWQPEFPTSAAANSTAGSAGPCTCGCDYPISMGVLVNLTIIGVGTTLKSVFVALRCLKGLRRSQWANLLSVVFPVPVTLYSVDWTQKNGQPIRHRTKDVAVQEEVAFDPFAMMDEQLDSAFTTLHLRPEPVHTFERAASGELTLVRPRRTLEMPSIPAPQKLQVRDAEYVGCCGFPWPTGGKQGVYDSEFVAQLGSERDSDQEDGGSKAEREEAELDLVGGAAEGGEAELDLVGGAAEGGEAAGGGREEGPDPLGALEGGEACAASSSLEAAERPWPLAAGSSPRAPEQPCAPSPPCSPDALGGCRASSSPARWLSTPPSVGLPSESESPAPPQSLRLMATGTPEAPGHYSL